MKMAIKYCGGCNSQFERSNIAERLESEYVHFDFIYSPNKGEYDFAVIICGCARGCAGHKGIEGLKGKVMVTSKEDYQKIKEIIEKAND